MVKPQTKRKKNTNGIGLRAAVLPLLENKNPKRLPDQGKNLINKSNISQKIPKHNFFPFLPQKIE